MFVFIKYIKFYISALFLLLLVFTVLKLQVVSAQTSTTVSYQITSGGNDGYDVVGSSAFNTGTPVFSGGKDINGNIITAGFRFANITIPQGVTIQSATIDWQESWSGNYSAFVKTNIYAESSDNSITFSTSNLPRSRARTTAFTSYNSASEAINSGVWMSATTSNRPPDIGQVIQEVINRPGWSSGNALSIIMVDNASTNDWWWEFRSYESGAANAPKLTITYTTSGGPTPTPTFTPTPSPTPTPTPIAPTPTPGGATATPTPTTTAASATYFSIGAGYDDNLTRQLVRTNTDKLYAFAATVATPGLLKAYWSNTPGLPNVSTDMNGTISVTNPSALVSVDAVYDGGNIIHVLANDMLGNIKDYPFDLTNNTFKPAQTIANDGGIPASPADIGTVGISGMFDRDNTLHIAYWNNANHIIYKAYTYDALNNSLTLVPNSTTQVDVNGNANHPQVVISPFDNSVTVAWVNGQNGSGTMSARSRSAAGAWGAVEAASTGAVWTSPNWGINIDQGPSIVITSDGTKHLIYIENFGSCGGDYGRVHYVKKGPLDTAWTDQSISNFCSHAPGIATNASNELYILGHGHPVNPTCTRMEDMCYIKRNPIDGTWGSPVTFAVAPGTESFDSSASIKWSAIGWNRPEAIEFLFFKTPYSTPLLYYGRLDTPGGVLPTATPTPTPIPTYTLSGIVYIDTNGNGAQDPGEVGYTAGTNVTLSTSPSQTRITDTSGNYSFTTIPAGTYDVTLTVPGGYTATTTNPATVALSANTTQNFGIAAVPTPTPTPLPAGNNVLQFDGVDDTAQTVGIYTGSTGTQTLEAWVRPATNNAFGMIIHTRNDADNQGWLLELRNGQAELWVADGTTDRNLLHTGVTMIGNTWYHVAATYNASTQNGQVFVNGTPSNLQAMGVLNLGPRFRMGTFGGGGFTVYNACNCQIEEVRVSNNLRYTGAFTPPTAPFIADANTLLLYHFDEGVGQSVTDASGNNQTLTLGTTSSSETTDPLWLASTAPITGGGATATPVPPTNTPTPTLGATPTPTPAPTYMLSGTVYIDTNGNGAQDLPGEIGYTGGTNVTLSTVPSQVRTTDSSGNYSFTTIPAGTYDVTLTVPTGHSPTTANPVLNLPLVANTTVNFGINIAPTPTLTATPTAIVNTPTPTVGSTATPTPTQTPGSQRSLQFDGVNDFVRAVDLPLSTIFTYEAWVRRTSDTGGYETFLSDASSNYNQAMFVLYVDGGNADCSGATDQFAYYQSASSSIQCSGITAQLNQWYYVAVTRDGAGVRRFFVNGVLASSQAGSVAPTNSSGRFSLGRAGNYNGEYFAGLIDEVRISNTAVYTTPFTPPTSQLSSSASTVLLYHLNEGSGQTVADASGNNRNGTLGSTTSVQSSDPAWSTNSPIK